MDWFLYDNGLRLETVKIDVLMTFPLKISPAVGQHRNRALLCLMKLKQNSSKFSVKK